MSDIFIDFTHVTRRTTGIERVTKNLFSGVLLKPLSLRQLHAIGNSRWQIVLAQWFNLPIAAHANPNRVFIFPGYPPSFWFPLNRVKAILYIHDVFLITRRQDLNRAAKYYMAPQFRRALKRIRMFFCNSEDTERKLRQLIHPDATTILFRPAVENVFSLSSEGRAIRSAEPSILRIVSLGTVEPRKNFGAGAKLCAALARHLGRPVEFHVIGRRGWGDAWQQLLDGGNCVLHGYLDESQARAVIENADLALCTSHEEGLGLPLLELQYAGLSVIAPMTAVFQEVLGESGIFVDPNDLESAATSIAHRLGAGWRSRSLLMAAANLERWNNLAATDRDTVVAYLQDLGGASK